MTWLNDELEKIKKENKENNKFLKFEPNTVVVVSIDFTVPPEVVLDTYGSTRARFRCIVDGTLKLWDVNIKNPIYKELIVAASNNITTFNIIKTGTGKETRYTILDRGKK